LNRDQADKVLADGRMCTAVLSGQVFICWIESILQIRGKCMANVRTVRGRKQLVEIDMLSLVDQSQVQP
jgi:hypothetical protein